MKDEDKVKEILGCPCCFKNPDCEACFERIKLLEMAAWKEQQMIEKAAEWLLENAKEYVVYDFDAEDYSVREDLVDDFREAMDE